MDDKLHNKYTINSQIILQGRSIDISSNIFPDIRSKSYHCKSSTVPVDVNNGSKSVEGQVKTRILSTPPSSLPQNKSFMKRMIHRVVTSLNYDIVDERKLVSENRDISMIQKSSKKSSKSSPSEISEVSNATNSQVYLLMKLAQSIRDLSLNMGTDIIPEISSHNNGDHIA